MFRTLVPCHRVCGQCLERWYLVVECVELVVSAEQEPAASTRTDHQFVDLQTHDGTGGEHQGWVQGVNTRGGAGGRHFIYSDVV